MAGVNPCLTDHWSPWNRNRCLWVSSPHLFKRGGMSPIAASERSGILRSKPFWVVTAVILCKVFQQSCHVQCPLVLPMQSAKTFTHTVERCQFRSTIEELLKPPSWMWSLRNKIHSKPSSNVVIVIRISGIFLFTFSFSFITFLFKLSYLPLSLSLSSLFKQFLPSSLPWPFSFTVFRILSFLVCLDFLSLNHYLSQSLSLRLSLSRPCLLFVFLYLSPSFSLFTSL